MTAQTDNAPQFFVEIYKSLRGFPPMLWMKRMFSEIIEGKPPSLVDLPTGAGKTDLIVIWLIALGWYGKHRQSAEPIPRRMVWVVNRRVLVQQVFRIAAELLTKVRESDDSNINMLRCGLKGVSADPHEFLGIVELRGQIVADRDWAIRPSIPQLIVGTVDQIGSRILFQGYGLGRWGRPQQAGLLGVDAWIAVDEAHLTPAFVLTLRQLQDKCAKQIQLPVDSITGFFEKLPFRLTELSATPGLPEPLNDGKNRSGQVFRLKDKEKQDALLADRILASDTRQVLLSRFPKGKKSTETRDALVSKLVEAALQSNESRIAIFVREVAVADKVASSLKGKLKEQGISDDHICKITGRIRGYERDRLAEKRVFRAFVEQRDNANEAKWYLVGTAAAEVGLDADADAIFCDFAGLPILLQRLGRLDRRGVLSRLHKDANGTPPTMVIFTEKERDAKLTDKVNALAKALKKESAPFSAELISGAHWHQANTGTKDKKKAENSSAGGEANEKPKDISPDLVEAATWSILNPDENSCCAAPSQWLNSDLAAVTSGPVIVPPVTDALLDYWATTTDARSAYLAPHPFLYGLSDNDEGTPLVGVAFRLEVEALREEPDEDVEAQDASGNVLNIFRRFPPLRSELHYLKLSTVRDWLLSEKGTEHPVVYRTHEEWRVKSVEESADTIASKLGPNATLILPANMRMTDDCKNLLKDCEQTEGKHTHISDVLGGVTGPQRARYRRTIEPRFKIISADGACHWDFDADQENSLSKDNPNGFRLRLSKKLSIGGTVYTFRYYRPTQGDGNWQYLDEFDGRDGHLTLAKTEAERLAQAIAPENKLLSRLLSEGAQFHDEGKRLPKWQHAFGWSPDKPELAKLAPNLEKPGALHGFRHEWESLLRLLQNSSEFPKGASSESASEFQQDLLRHLIGSHHGHLRPSITDAGLSPTTEVGKQNALRLDTAERFFRLQGQLGRWRLAYLEALLKAADAVGSQTTLEEDDDEQ